MESDSASLLQKNNATKTVRTTCPYCGVGCGVLATVDNSTGKVSVKGDPEHPANLGKLCSKGSNLAETLREDRRLTYPYYQNKQISMQNSLPHDLTNSLIEDSQSQQADHCLAIQQIDWETVITDVATRLNDTINQHGPESVMFYVSGQLLTEDYYVANKLMKGFIGSNNIDSNSRLCMSSAVAGHKRAFGADIVPGSYTDFEDCDLLVLVGSNMAWCHPILFSRFLKAKQENPTKKLVVIDPRRTDSCEFADLHLPIVAGSDTHLYNGLLKYLKEKGCEDVEYTADCVGMQQAIDSAQKWSIEAVAEATQVDAVQIEKFYQLVAANNKTITAFSMGVNQSRSGTDKVNAITNTHLFTGRVAKPGASPFSLTGQPNAMGGREVGALSNLLAGHLSLDSLEHRQAVAEFWQSPKPIEPETGVKACDVADAILEGKVKAIWIMATNPVVSLPEADKFRNALAQCDLVIVSECSKDSDTIRCADIVLPAQAWSEKSGTVTNSERRISRQRSLLPGVGGSKPDWWILSQVAKQMGFEGFDYTQPSEIFLEHAALTRYKQDEYPRQLDLVTDFERHGQDYELMTPLQWGGKHIDVNSKQYKQGAPKFIAIEPPKQAGAVNSYGMLNSHLKQKSEANLNLESESETSTKRTSKNINLRLITGRLRDQWHTMTRTALAPKLNQQQAVPTLTLHPRDAEKLGVDNDSYVLMNADLSQLGLLSNDSALNNSSLNNSSSNNKLPKSSTKPQSASSLKTSHVVAQVKVSNEMRVGDGFMPMHWSDAFASLARVGTLIPTKVDPISSQPELKNSAITVKSLNIKSVGCILVHPDWMDAVLVQLRQLADNNQNHSEPEFIWSLSRQQDCILINMGVCSDSLHKDWLTADFWQQWVARLTHLSQSFKTKSAQTTISKTTIKNRDLKEVSEDNAIATSFMVNSSAEQLRLVVSQSTTIEPEFKYNSKSAAKPTPISIPNSKAVLSELSEQLMMAVYIAPNLEQLPSAHWLNSCFEDMSQVPSVKWLLAGRPASGYVDPGPIVCACMGVGENTIIDTIISQGCSDASAVGSLCQAGTNCGSCIGQINELIKEHQLNRATEMA
nr:molybdopterin-dependent oxidoreductase [Psychrobacter lutiphocae]